VQPSLKQSVKFELERSNVARLHKLARAEAISPSMLMNQMLVQYLGVRTASTISEYIPIRKILLIRLLKKFSEKEVVEIARSIARLSARKIILKLRQEYHIMSSVDVVEAMIRISNHKYKHDVNHGIHRFSISHSLGKKWSLYLYEIYGSVLQQFKFKKVDISVSGQQLTFTIIVKSIM